MEFECLPDRCQFAVQRHKGPAVRAGQFRHKMACHDKRLLIRRGNVLPCLHCSHCWPDSHPGHETVDNQIDLFIHGKIDQPALPFQNLDLRRQTVFQPHPISPHTDAAGTESFRLGTQQICVPPGTETDDFESVGKRCHHVQRVRTDRPRRPQYGHSLHHSLNPIRWS